jgi:uncharacterized protein YxjI
MNLSSDTVSLLKNFSDINQNILVKPGNKVQTISTMKNILAEAEISEKFESEFAIYDLPEFLRSVELFEKPELKFNGGSNVQIADSNSKQAIKYFFADKSVIVSPTKNITMPDKEVTFTFKKETFAKLLKAATTLNLPDIAVKGNGKSINLVATDKKNKSSNEYSLVVGETDKSFTAYFKTENFKMVSDDYDVAISKQKISHFVNRNKPIQYWIALEPDSEF